MVFTTDNIHDRVAVDLAARMALLNDSTTTVATVEEGDEEESHEVGIRVIKQLLRDAGVETGSHIEPTVYLGNQTERDVAEQADSHDVVFVAANQQSDVRKLMELTARPTIAVVKRAPPLRDWGALGALRDLIPQLNPGDYADLIQSLRRGSRFNTDFRMMLGLAAVIATLGLLQDSPAIVIGSMLLAPLMTPMVGAGLSLAQANVTLAKSSLKAIAFGFLMTLAISYTVAFVTPGEDLTAQVIARGDPNLLDLLVAIASAMAAAYAMARPSIVGAIAGVAIATALVPPLCSCGIALAYRQGLLALGTSVLFITNLVAIIIGAAAVFRFMGVTSARADKKKQRWVYQVVAGLGLIALALSVPLEIALVRQIEMGKPHPIAYMVPRSVGMAVVKRVDAEPGVEVILMGRPSTIDPRIDVAIYLASPQPLPRAFADELVEIVRHEMNNDELRVFVSCLQESWLGTEPTKATSGPAAADDP